MAVIAAENIHVVIIDHTGMRVARTWALLLVKRVDLLPFSGLNAVFVEVINTIVSIVAAKNVDLASVDYCSMAVTWTGRGCTAIRVELTPSVSREIEAIKVVAAVRTVVSSKDVKVVVQGH